MQPDLDVARPTKIERERQWHKCISQHQGTGDRQLPEAMLSKQCNVVPIAAAAEATSAFGIHHLTHWLDWICSGTAAECNEHISKCTLETRFTSIFSYHLLGSSIYLIWVRAPYCGFGETGERKWVYRNCEILYRSGEFVLHLILFMVYISDK